MKFAHRFQDQQEGDHQEPETQVDDHKSDASEGDNHGADDHSESAEGAADHGEGGHGEEAHGDSDHAHEISAEDWTVQNSMDWYLSPDHLIGHVQDQTFFDFPAFNFKDTVAVPLPNPFGFTNEEPFHKFSTEETDAHGTVTIKEHDFLGNITFQPTKFIVLELFAALIVAAVFITLGRKMRSGNPVRGKFWNMLEAGCTYVRDEIARPSIGAKDADRFLPILWTVFFFVLTMNLVGMIPGFGAATGSISITASLALVVFAVVLYVGMTRLGVVGFWAAQAPHINIDGALSPLKYILVPLIWAIEIFGLFIKHLVLAVRLFANMFAGHLVLAVFVAFIGVVWNTMMVWGVVPAVFGASIGINLLELLVAFIQAYVFTFLTALFIGAAIHPH